MDLQAADWVLLGACVTSLGFNLPQLYQTYTTRNARNLSLYTILLRILTQSLWVVYGVLTSNSILVGVTCQNIVTECALACMKIRFTTENGVVVSLA